jgi:hypothetical protein
LKPDEPDEPRDADTQHATLPYRAGVDDASRRGRAAGGLFAAGFVTSVAIVLIGGFLWFTSLYPDFIYWSRPSPRLSAARVPIFLFVVVGVACLSAAYEVYRSRRQPWFSLGMLCGGGVIGLVEGICFANPA